MKAALDAFVRDRAAGRHRRGAAPAVQGPTRRSSAGARRLAVRPRPRDLRGGRRLPARRGGRLHPHLEPADQDLGRRAADAEAARVVDAEPEARAAGGPLWAGRLAGGLDRVLLAFSRSLPVDQALFPYDVRASIAHVAHARRGRGCSTRPTRRRSPPPSPSSSRRRRRAGRGRPLLPRAAARRAARASSAGACMPAARATTRSRSRRGSGRGRLPRAGRARRRAAGGARGAARATPRLVLPGYTHLQRAQPVLLGHHLAAHAWALARDVERLRAARDAADVSPLGAGALAGLEPAARPGLDGRRARVRGAFENSLDAVADRDFVCRPPVRLRALRSCTSRGSARRSCSTRARSSRFARARRRVAQGSLDDAAEEEPPGRRAPARPRRRRDRPPDGLPRRRQGAAARLRLRPAGGQGGCCFGQVAALDGALEAAALLVRRAALRPSARLRPPPATAWCVATDVAEALVRDGVPFREAHERVAGRSRRASASPSRRPRRRSPRARCPAARRPSASPSSSPPSTGGSPTRARSRRVEGCSTAPGEEAVPSDRQSLLGGAEAGAHVRDGAPRSTRDSRAS